MSVSFSKNCMERVMPPNDIEEQIEAAYRKLCMGRTKTAKTQAWNEMLRLQGLRSWEVIDARSEG